jgi:hypothetical protein
MEDVQPIDRFVVEEYLLDVLFYLNGWCVFSQSLCSFDVFVCFFYIFLAQWSSIHAGFGVDLGFCPPTIAN